MFYPYAVLSQDRTQMTKTGGLRVEFLFSHRWTILIVWLIVINLISILITIHDKRSAQKGRWRVRENTLLLLGVLGGAIGMLVTMKKIHHKTKHMKFMVGLPLILLVQVGVLMVSIWKWGF